MQTLIAKDLKGNNLSVGDKVIFAIYERDSDLNIGKIDSFNDKHIIVKTDRKYYKRMVKIKESEKKLLRI